MKWCLGDLVGYFHQSLEVLDLMIKSGIPTILGNHDAYLINKLPYSREKDELINLGYVQKKMTAAQRQWLNQRPLFLESSLDNKTLAAFHASPWTTLEEYVYPNYKHFKRFSKLSWDYIFLGHTHYPLLKTIGKVTIINPGSCGQPRQGDYRACAVILDVHRGKVEFLHIEYDIEKVLSQAKKKGVHPKVIHKLKSAI